MRNRSNALLVELMIVIMFFLMASTVLLEAFGKAKSLSVKSEMIAASIVETQNVADQLYVTDHPQDLLTSLGFTEENGEWVLREDRYAISVVLSKSDFATGILFEHTVTAKTEEETLITLPVVRFMEAG